ACRPFALFLTRRAILAALVALALFATVFTRRTILIAARWTLVLASAVFAALFLLWARFLPLLARVFLLPPFADAIAVASWRAGGWGIAWGRRHRLHRLRRQRGQLLIFER